MKVLLDEEPLELTFDSADGFGIAPEVLVADDHSPCQDLAQGFRIASDGPRSFLAPSAALPGTVNLVLLDPFVAISFDMHPVAPEDLPVAMAAQDGRCPEDLWELVHYRGSPTPHPALEAWRAGEDFEFVEPSVSLGGITV